jgi:hypothetical protein
MSVNIGPTDDVSGRVYVDDSSVSLSTVITSLPATLPNGDLYYTFDGTEDYLEADDDALFSIAYNGTLTWEVWMRPDTLEFPRVEGSNYVHFLGKGDVGNHEWAGRMYNYHNLEVPPRPNRVACYAWNLIGNQGAGSYFQETVNPGEWIHVVASYSVAADRIRIYKNGVMTLASTLSSYSIVPVDGASPLRLGTKDGFSFFKGALAKVAIYNSEISAATVANHYTTMMSASTTYDSVVTSDSPSHYWTLSRTLSNEGLGPVVGSKTLIKHRASFSGNSVLVDGGPSGLTTRASGTVTGTFTQQGVLQTVGKLASGSATTNLPSPSGSAQISAISSVAGDTVYNAQGASTASRVIRGQVAGDVGYRAILRMDGLWFGPGVDSTGDVGLYRNAADEWRTDKDRQQAWYQHHLFHGTSGCSYCYQRLYRF